MPADVSNVERAVGSGDKFFLQALAACGDHHAYDVDLVERYLAIAAEQRRLEANITKLMDGRSAQFQQRCRDEITARAELAELKTRTLLEEWSTGFWASEFPH